MNFLTLNQVSYSILSSNENKINKSISIQCRVINNNVNHKTYRISMLKFNSFSYTYLPLMELFSFYKKKKDQHREA